MFSQIGYYTFSINGILKRTTTILLFTIYLFSTTGISEFFKINALLQHYKESKIIEKKTTFLHFLVMHYITDDLNNNDNNLDKQLPFKSSDISFSQLPSINNATQKISIISIPSFQKISKPFFKHNDANLFASFHTLVWHPPKNG